MVWHITLSWKLLSFKNFSHVSSKKPVIISILFVWLQYYFSLVFSLCFVVYISWSDSLGRVCPAYYFMHCVGQLGTQFNIPFYIRISLIGNLKMLPFITISVFVICSYFVKFLCHKWKFLSWFFKFLSLLFILIF